MAVGSKLRRRLRLQEERPVPARGQRLAFIGRDARIVDGGGERAEDPGETLDYSYEKQLQLLQDVKRGLAGVNYGWRCREGKVAYTACGSPGRSASATASRKPGKCR